MQFRGIGRLITLLAIASQAPLSLSAQDAPGLSRRSVWACASFIDSNPSINWFEALRFYPARGSEPTRSQRSLPVRPCLVLAGKPSPKLSLGVARL